MGKKKVLTEEDMSKRLYIPTEGQVLGQVVQQLGYDRFRVRCQDGKERNVRIRGKLKRRAWTRVNDWVLVEPWDFQTDRGNILWRYTSGQVELLQSKGYIRR
jgi:translation initiation factor 1A